MPIPPHLIHSTKHATPGHVFVVSGTVLEPRSPILLPIFSPRLAVLMDSKLVAEEAFAITTVQHPTMFLLQNARQQLGDVTFDGDAKTLKVHLEVLESAMLTTVAEAEAALEAQGRSPTAAIEEELTLLTMQALRDRLASMSEAGAQTA